MPDAPEAAGLKLKKLKEVVLPTPVLAVEAAPEGKRLFAACQDGLVYVVDPESGKVDPLGPGRHTSYASGLALLPDGRTLVSGGYDGRLIWHDVESGRVIREVRAHDFWSWDLAASADGKLLASVTGRYEVGGYKYEPAPEREPSVKVFDAADGGLRAEFPHVPPVQAVAFSPDGTHVAAGNLMGEVRVWNVASKQEVSRWTDDGLTSWGVIKSHHFLGGVFSLQFSPDGRELYVCGMGPMVDPMAGNGVQRWQRFEWRTGKRLDQTHENESGHGLMETLAFHPSGRWFVMAGRLFQGSWNLALFETGTGKNVLAVDAHHRITQARFLGDGSRLVLAKMKGQEKPKDGQWKDSGLIEIHELTGGAA